MFYYINKYFKVEVFYNVWKEKSNFYNFLIYS